MKLATRTSIINRYKKSPHAPYHAKLVNAQEQYYGFREWWQINEHVTLTIIFTEREFADEKESSLTIYTPTCDITKKVAEQITLNLHKINITTKDNGVILIDLRREDFDEVLAEIEAIIKNITYPERPLLSAC